MEANEAPEKIYINPNPENRTWLIGKGDISFIEYTRTDAFIEKSCKFLKNNLEGYDLEEEDKERIIEDFKAVMKYGYT